MASQTPEHGSEPAATYDSERWATITALLCAILIGVGILGLFMFITWFTYATE